MKPAFPDLPRERLETSGQTVSMNSMSVSFAGGKISLARETGLTETRRAEKRFRTQKLKKRAISTPLQPNRRSPSALAGINTRSFDDPAHPRLDLGCFFRFDRLIHQKPFLS